MEVDGNGEMKWFDNNFYYDILEPVRLIKTDSPSADMKDSKKPHIVLENKEIAVEDSECIGDIFKISLYLREVWINNNAVELK